MEFAQRTTWIIKAINICHSHDPCSFNFFRQAALVCVCEVTRTSTWGNEFSFITPTESTPGGLLSFEIMKVLVLIILATHLSWLHIIIYKNSLYDANILEPNVTFKHPKNLKDILLRMLKSMIFGNILLFYIQIKKYYIFVDFDLSNIFVKIF